MTKITIALTSCGRINLLKKTIISLGKSCDISEYEKLITEDTRDLKKIENIKKENKNGFLKGWKIFFTGGVGATNEEKHFNALKKIYQEIKTDYVFHLEDDWFFEASNIDFIKISKEILEKNTDIGLIQIRNFEKDGGYNHLKLTKEERKNELFAKENIIFLGQSFLKFRNDNNGDTCKGFSLNPGLRRTQEAKSIMFGNKNIKRVDESLFGEKMTSMGLSAIKMEPGVCHHTGNSFLSTKILEKGFFEGFKKTVIGIYNYRIKTLLIERKVKPLFHKLYQILDLFGPTRYLMDIASYLQRTNSITEITKNSLTNIEGIKEMNIPLSWFTEEKTLGISGVARLKNGDDFLERVVESHLSFLDEIILVDNQSTDQTKKICLKLEQKYPEKIKFFEYNYDVKSQGRSNNQTPNSIYSLAYFYNWCFSKSKYKYVMKVDDDNLFLKEKGKQLRQYILNQQPNNYVTYWGLNLFKQGREIGICSGNKYLGKYGDHGIYPVSKRSYYIQKGECECFVTPLFFKRFGFCFFHLKFFKKDYGLTNYIATQRGKAQLKVIENSKLIPIEKIVSGVKIPQFLLKK